MRLFVSIDLPDDLAEGVRSVQGRFADASGLNFTDPDRTHVTLKFLGDASEEELPQVKEAIRRGVEDAAAEPFSATFGGLGVFPDLEYISVVWLGVEEGGAEMHSLHEGVESRTAELGFDPEDREFTPHVTLARMDHAGGKELVQDVVRERDPTVGTMEVSEVRLTESVLTDEGPEYSTVESFRL